MTEQRHTRETILETLKNLAERLGKKVLSKQDVQPHLPVSSIRYHFGSLGNALEAAGLERTDPAEHLRGRGPVLSDDQLMEALYELETRIGHEPRFTECSLGLYSTKPYRKRFGRWADALAQYRRWKAEREVAVPVPNHAPCPTPLQAPAAQPRPLVSAATGGSPSHGQQYGEYLNFRGLIHAPTNEQGVVLLFGMVFRELGFSIEAVQQGFPDCEAKCAADNTGRRLRRVGIEFEYRASEFAVYGHDASKCDMIVCWENDWPDCPLQVLELREAILKLPQR